MERGAPILGPSRSALVRGAPPPPRALMRRATPPTGHRGARLAGQAAIKVRPRRAVGGAARRGGYRCKARRLTRA